MEVLLTHVGAGYLKSVRKKGSASPKRERSDGQSGTVSEGRKTLPEPLFRQADGWNCLEGSSFCVPCGR